MYCLLNCLLYTLSVFLEKHINVINTHSHMFRHFFPERQPPEAAHLPSTGVCLSRFSCTHKILVHAQHSCACTTLLCMHWRGQGPRPRPNNKTDAGPARRGCFCWVPALVPGPSSACTRVLCIHKSVVHAQESCACTRILCIYNSILI